MAEARTFVDTNILLYAHDRDAGARHHDAVGVVDGLWERESGALSTQVIQELYANITRKLARPLSPSAARDLIADYGTWPVHQVTVQDTLDASSLAERHTLSFWDGLIVVAALRTGSTVLLSEDLQAGRAFGPLVIRNPLASPSETPPA